MSFETRPLPPWGAAADDGGATALHVAAETGVVAVLESLLAAAAERDASLSLVSTERSETNANANANDDVRLVGASALARRRTNAGKTALHVACRAGNAASARVLLALCPDSLDARDAGIATDTTNATDTATLRMPSLASPYGPEVARGLAPLLAPDGSPHRDTLFAPSDAAMAAFREYARRAGVEDPEAIEAMLGAGG